MNYFWVSIDKFGNVILKTIGIIIIARILSPENFGVFSVASTFIAFANVIVDSGLGGALIKKQDANEKDFSTVFIFNLTLSIVLYIFICLFSKNISEYFNIVELNSVIPLISLLLIIKSLSLIQITYLTKELKFKVQAKISFISYLISFVFGYYFACNGFGVFSLVYMSLIEAIILLTLYTYVGKVFPKLYFSLSSFKEMYSFGFFLMLSSILKTAYENALSLILTKNFGAVQSGYYYQANRVNQIFVNTVTTIINKAAFPIIVKSINDNNKSFLEMQKVCRFSCAVCFFIFAIISVYSQTIISILFGEKWIKSAPMLSIIILSGYGMIVESLTRSYLKSYGKASLIFKLEVLKRSLGLSLIVFCLQYDLKVILWAYVISTIMSALINIYTTTNNVPYKTRILLYDIGLPLFTSLVVLFLGNYIVSNFIFFSSLIGMFFYTTVSFVTSFTILFFVGYFGFSNSFIRYFKRS